MAEFKSDSSLDATPSRHRLPSPGCLFAVALVLILLPVYVWMGIRVHRQQVRLEYFQQFEGARVETKPARPALGEERAAGFTEITTIDLDGTSISDGDLRQVSGVTNLAELDLGHTAITDAGLRHQSGLSNLQVLYLEHTQGSNAGLQQPNGLTNLEDLYLEDGCLQHLGGLTHLKELSVDYTGVADSDLQLLVS